MAATHWSRSSAEEQLSKNDRRDVVMLNVNGVSSHDEDEDEAEAGAADEEECEAKERRASFELSPHAGADMLLSHRIRTCDKETLSKFWPSADRLPRQ
jgi:hypothetical protein